MYVIGATACYDHVYCEIDRHDVVVARKSQFYKNFSSSDILNLLNLRFKDCRNLISFARVFYNGDNVDTDCD